MLPWKTVVLTGGTGLVGKDLAALLLKEGVHVRIPTRSEQSQEPGIAYMHGNLNDPTFCSTLLHNADALLHCASERGNVKIHKEEYDRIHDANILLSQNLIAACKEQGNVSTVFCSTALASKANRKGREDDGYVQGKVACEELWNQYHKETGAPLLILRPVNIYGPGEPFDPKGNVIPALTAKAINAEDTLNVWGSGKQKRAFLYSPDVAAATMKLLQEGQQGTVFLAPQEVVTIAQIATMITSIINPDLTCQFDTSTPEGGATMTIDSAPDTLREFPWTPLQQGLQMTIRAWKDQHVSSKR